MISERKQQLLKLIIENHIETAEPIGSKFLVSSGDLKVSDATVRNEMRDLENAGFLTHPHTSAGRIPTEEGYKYYVNDLIKNNGAGSSDGRPASEIKDIIREKVSNADNDIEDLSNEYPTDGRITTYMLRKAILADKLERLNDPFLGDPEILFEQALERARIFSPSSTAAFVMYHFADFLAHNRSISQKDDIINLLGNFYGEGGRTIESGKNKVFFEFLMNEKNDISGARSNIVQLADIDPDFKELLNTKLGWSL